MKSKNVIVSDNLSSPCYVDIIALPYKRFCPGARTTFISIKMRLVKAVNLKPASLLYIYSPHHRVASITMDPANDDENINDSNIIENGNVIMNTVNKMQRNYECSE